MLKDQEPITLPVSPFWEVFKDFGRDELIALLLNTVGVAGLSRITSSPVLLSIFGPILEKAGFFVMSSKEASDVYRTTSREQRKPKTAYLKDAVNNGLPNLSKDIFFHDPLYTIGMLIGLATLPETPAWIVSIVVFLLSVLLVSAGEISTKEALYFKEKSKLLKDGFAQENQLESRFIVENVDPEQLIQDLANYFQLGEIQTNKYVDTYFEGTGRKPYNERRAVVRIRRRSDMNKEIVSETFQVVYTRASQVARENPDQFSYFPIEKDKFKIDLSEIDESVKNKLSSDSIRQVESIRSFAHTDKLFISVDQVQGENGYTVVEVKSFRDDKEAVDTMIMVMRHIMSNYTFVHTNHSKKYLTSL